MDAEFHVRNCTKHGQHHWRWRWENWEIRGMATEVIRQIDCPTPGGVIRLKHSGNGATARLWCEYEPSPAPSNDGEIDTTIVAECVD